jgi:hypothetical protein
MGKKQYETVEKLGEKCIWDMYVNCTLNDRNIINIKQMSPKD